MQFIKALFARFFGPTPVASCICDLNKSIAKLKTAEQQHASLALRRKAAAERLTKAADQSWNESTHAARVAARMKEIVS